MAKRRTIPGTNIPIGRKKSSGGGLTQRQKDQTNRDIKRDIEQARKNERKQRAEEKAKPQAPPNYERRRPRLGSKERPRLYGTEGDRLSNVPFNVDYFPRNKEVAALFNQAGYDSWRDIFINKADIADLGSKGMTGYRRGHVFNTPNEAIAYGKDILRVGLLRIYYDERTDKYYVYVMDSS